MRAPRIRPHPAAGYLKATLVLATFALFGWACARQVVTGSVRFDDAFIANVAKNLATGHGYSSSFYGIHPFDPEISTGPTLVFPTAALIALVGNRYWVPHLAYSLCVWFTLAIVVALVRRLSGIDTRIAASVLVLGLLVFGNDGFGLLGEVPGSLMVAAGALTVADKTRAAGWRLTLAGMAFGCATLTKAVVLLAVAPALLWLILSSSHRGSRMPALAVFTSSFLAPLAAFELWKAASLADLGMYWQVKQGELDLLASPASHSGWGSLISLGALPRVTGSTLHSNSARLAADWGGWLPLLATLAATIAAIACSGLVSRASRTDGLRTPCLLLLSAALVHGLWWLLICPTGWPRHLLPGILYWLVAMALLTAQLWIDHWRCSMVVVGLLLIGQAPQAAPVAGAEDEARLVLLLDHLRLDLKREARLVGLLETSKFMEGLAADRGTLAVGCGWWHNPDLEYISPFSATFRDCLSLHPDETRGRRLLLVRSEFFNLENSERLRRFQESCEQRVLFRAPPFTVSECRSPSD